MPAFVINPNDTVQIKTACYNNVLLQLGLNVVYYRVTTDDNMPVDSHAILSGYDIAVAPLYLAMLGSDCEYYGSQIQSVTTPIFAPDNTSVNQAQSATGSLSLPNQVSGIITKRSGLAGRAHRGRMYIPFPAQIFDSGTGFPTLAYIALLQAIATQTLTSQTYPSLITANNGTLVPQVYGKQQLVPPFNAAHQEDVTGYTVQPRWATQRRRGQYGAFNALPW